MAPSHLLDAYLGMQRHIFSIGKAMPVVLLVFASVILWMDLSGNFKSIQTYHIVYLHTTRGRIVYVADISQSVDMVLAFNLHKATITSNLNSQITNYCQLVKVKVSYLTSVAKQAKTAFLHGLTVWKSPRRDWTRNLSLRKRCTNHCTAGPHTVWQTP